MSECATFAKGERHGVTQAMSTTEWRATAERPEGTQGMSKSEGLAKGEGALATKP